MSRGSVEAEDGLYKELRSTSLQSGYASELYNLRKHCVYKSYCIDMAEETDMVICTTEVAESRTLELIKYGMDHGITIVLLSPYETPEREEMCESIIKSHTSTTLDRRAYLIIFNNHLPKQHFQL